MSDDLSVYGRRAQAAARAGETAAVVQALILEGAKAIEAAGHTDAAADMYDSAAALEPMLGILPVERRPWWAPWRPKPEPVDVQARVAYYRTLA